MTVSITDSDNGKVVSRRYLRHKHRNPHLDQPSAKLVLCQGGPLAVIVFQHGLVVTLLEQNSTYEQEFNMKNHNDKVLTVGAWSDFGIDANVEFVGLMSESGVLGGQVHVGSAREVMFRPENFEDKTMLVKQIIEQAGMFYDILVLLTCV